MEGATFTSSGANSRETESVTERGGDGGGFFFFSGMIHLFIYLISHENTWMEKICPNAVDLKAENIPQIKMMLHELSPGIKTLQGG